MEIKWPTAMQYVYVINYPSKQCTSGTQWQPAQRKSLQDSTFQPMKHANDCVPQFKRACNSPHGVNPCGLRWVFRDIWRWLSLHNGFDIF